MLHFGLGVLVGIVISYLFGVLLIRQEEAEYRLTQKSADELAQSIFELSQEPGWEFEVKKMKSMLLVNGYKYDNSFSTPKAIKEH